jgi:hypothetical protein
MITSLLKAIGVIVVLVIAVNVLKGNSAGAAHWVTSTWSSIWTFVSDL